MRLPFLKTLGTLTLGLALAGPCALPLHAEEGEEEGDPRAKIRAQIEKVLRLMAENEAALLKASTQGGNRPDGPDVPIPDLPEQGQPQGSGGQGAGGQGTGGQGTGGQGSSGQGSSGQGSSGQGGGSRGGPEGEEAKRALEELLKSAAEGGGSARIPGELEELIRMVPLGSSGGGGGQPSGGGGEQETPEAREARQRKQLEEQQRREQAEKDGKQPEGGERKPHDPNDPASKDPETPPDPQNPNAKPWHATLPPELREFFAGGGLEKLPARLRKIVEDYQRSLDRQTGPAEGSPR